MPAASAIGVSRTRISNLHKRFQRHGVVGHRRPQTLVVRRIGDRYSDARPALGTRPYRHPAVGVCTRRQGQDLLDGTGDRRRAGLIAQKRQLATDATAGVAGQQRA